MKNEDAVKAGLPPSTEWDFSTKNKKDWDSARWEACFYYEFTRKCQTIRERVAHARQGCPATLKDYKKVLLSGGTRALPEAWLKHRFPFWPEWPNTPFQEIDIGEMRTRLQRSSEKRMLDPLVVSQQPLNYVIGLYKDYAVVPDLEGECWIDEDYENSPLWNGRDTIKTLPGAELVCFEIDWSFGKRSVVHSFAQWVKEFCPQRVPWSGHEPNPRCSKGKRARLKQAAGGTILGCVIEGRRGGSNITKRRQAALKRLGALQIWKHFKGEWREVHHRLEHIVPLLGDQFKHQAGWSRALGRVGLDLARFNNSIANLPYC